MIQTVKKYLKNSMGRLLKRKLVAFQVDDWGSIRIKDKDAYNYLLSKDIPVNTNRFCKYDSLATELDLISLLEVLSSVKDKHGHTACFTAVMNPANPDFKKIKEAEFAHFYNEPFTKTLEKYGNGYENVFEIWKEGIQNNIFYPVFHGTEHVSRKRLMTALQSGHQPTLWAFEYESVGIPNVRGYKAVSGIMTPYIVDFPSDYHFLGLQITEGLDLFENLFGFRSRLFKAGGDVISPDLYAHLAKKGIEYIDESFWNKQHVGNDVYKKSLNYTGKINGVGQKVLVRNCVFEPTDNLAKDSVGNCLKDIDIAFKCKKPAIISSHRVNFVGALDDNNRKEGLKRLSALLKGIIKRWPDVEFVNTEQLGDIVFKGICND